MAHVVARGVHALAWLVAVFKAVGATRRWFGVGTGAVLLAAVAAIQSLTRVFSVAVKFTLWLALVRHVYGVII